MINMVAIATRNPNVADVVNRIKWSVLNNGVKYIIYVQYCIQMYKFEVSGHNIHVHVMCNTYLYMYVHVIILFSIHVSFIQCMSFIGKCLGGVPSNS